MFSSNAFLNLHEAPWFFIISLILLCPELTVHASDTVQGVVFHDRNHNGTFDRGEKRIPGVRVSNGVEVTRTDENGRYSLPVQPGDILFVAKPRGWKYLTGKNNLPKFYYIHKPEGSPDDSFRYRGSSPTGPLPDSVNFPLLRYETPDPIRAILVADPQTGTPEEVAYYGRTTVSELVDVDADFGITLGDLVFNKLDLLNSINELQALPGIPWHNVLGNHDLNFEANQNKFADETFERIYGPTNYAFQYGNVHFIVLDNVYYDGNGYQGKITSNQMQFLRQYLNTVPEDHRIVLAAHIPMATPFPGETEHETDGYRDLLNLLSDYPNTCSFSGHTHMNMVLHHGAGMGYTPEEETEHIHHNLGTASGSWWRGPLNHLGIPLGLMVDGTPRGYGIGIFEPDGSDFRVRYKATGRPEDYQMNIHAPDSATPEQISDRSVSLTVNVFNGSNKSKVNVRIVGETKWKPLQKALRPDPFFKNLYQRDQVHSIAGTSFKHEPLLSMSIWYGTLPSVQISENTTKLIEVRAEDAYGHTFHSYRPIRIKKR